jgi:hypothetical protein
MGPRAYGSWASVDRLVKTMIKLAMKWCQGESITEAQQEERRGNPSFRCGYEQEVSVRDYLGRKQKRNAVRHSDLTVA